MARIVIQRHKHSGHSKLYMNDDGLLDRKDGPALISSFGTVEWYTKGDATYVIYRDGEHYVYGEDSMLIEIKSPNGFHQKFGKGIAKWPEL